MVTGCNISQNTATRFAGGLHNGGQMDVVDSVISNNETGLGSAGISNWPEIAIMTLDDRNDHGFIGGQQAHHAIRR